MRKVRSRKKRTSTLIGQRISGHLICSFIRKSSQTWTGMLKVRRLQDINQQGAKSGPKEMCTTEEE